MLTADGNPSSPFDSVPVATAFSRTGLREPRRVLWHFGLFDPCPGNACIRRIMRIPSPLNWFGGKSRLALKVIRHFPQHHTYVEIVEKSEVRQLLIDYWMAHDNPDMSSRYAKQLTEDVEFRQKWAKKVGLGFVLPDVSETGTGLICATCATNSIGNNYTAKS